MNIEYEVTYPNVNHNSLREIIKELGWVCVQEKTLMKRVVFKEKDKALQKSYFRVRDEWNRITCTYKTLSDWTLNIESMKEIETEVSDFEATKKILELSWLVQSAYQESYRETWNIWESIYFMLDEWPWIQPFIEIEWLNEKIVKEYSHKLWFDYSQGIFGAVDQLYFLEHWIPHDVTNQTTVITFEKPLINY
jgi:adenylate cyclase class 2